MFINIGNYTITTEYITAKAEYIDNLLYSRIAVDGTLHRVYDATLKTKIRLSIDIIKITKTQYEQIMIYNGHNDQTLKLNGFTYIGSIKINAYKYDNMFYNDAVTIIIDAYSVV